MARTLSRRGAFALPLLATLGLGLSGCSTKEDDSSGRTFDRLVYAVRQHTVIVDGQPSIDVAGGMGQVMDYNRYEPGGRLEVYDLTTGKTENVLEGDAFKDADVSSLDVSYDATKVVFTMKPSADEHYHVYWASLQRGADGKFEIHQLTSGAQDDEHAIWVPGNRIAFVTNEMYTDMGTRADEYEHGRVVTQIATITLDGGDADRKLCAQNLSHTINLFPLADGRVGFSRWEHLENVNDVKLFAMHPDCTQMVAISGQHGKPANSLVQVSETRTPNVFIAIGTDRDRTIQSGALIQIDARSASDPAKLNEEDPKYKELSPAVPTGSEPSPVGRYRAPSGLPDGRILTSWADGVVNDTNEQYKNPPDFGIYIYNPSTRQNQLIVNHEKSWELYAKPIVARTEPAILGSVQATVDSSIPVTLGSVNVRETSLGVLHGNTVKGAQFPEGTSIDDALKQTKKVRIIEGFSTEASPGNTMFGLTMAEGAALLGEAKVYEDGSWLAEVPPYVPIHLQPIDEFDLSIRSQTTWIQGMPGEDRVCGGCHENRTQPILPGGQGQTEAKGAGAQNFLLPVMNRTEYPWYGANDAANPNEIQKILNNRCVSCHNATTNGNKAQEYYTLTMANPTSGATTEYRLPRLDLSSTEVTVTYDKQTHNWPVSYVSLFYPAAFQMEMERIKLTAGKLPPAWALPSDARNSALIEKLNVASSADPKKYAWPLGQPFSNSDIASAGGVRTDHAAEVGLTREELVKLIRSIDMGGQYYARQNSDYQPFGGDPVAPGKKY